jgi:hypothetical protein
MIVSCFFVDGWDWWKWLLQERNSKNEKTFINFINMSWNCKIDNKISILFLALAGMVM